ncbi:MAG: HU family DNA-binding protein [Desulforhopalus sp.]
MNKGDLIEKVAKECGLSKTESDKVVNSVLGTITGAVQTGDKVTLIGFGTFSVTERAAREGRNPQSGKTIQIPAKKVIKFKAGKNLIDAVK